MGNYASDSGHFYLEDGTPFYETTSKDGSIRKTTLRDARKVNAFPSVTTILKVAASPGLEKWKQEQVVLSALTMPRPEGMDLTQLAKKIIEDSRHEAETKRDIGTDIHGVLEKFYQTETYEQEYAEYIYGVIDTIPKVEYDSEKSFAHKYGYAGKIDLHSKTEQIVIDFKTKEFTADDKMVLYDEHKMQLSAYAAGLGFNQPKMYICYVSTSVHGLCRLIEHTEFQRYYEMFLNLLGYYKLKNNYWPGEK